MIECGNTSYDLSLKKADESLADFFHRIDCDRLARFEAACWDEARKGVPVPLPEAPRVCGYGETIRKEHQLEYKNAYKEELITGGDTLQNQTKTMSSRVSNGGAIRRDEDANGSDPMASSSGHGVPPTIRPHTVVEDSKSKKDIAQKVQQRHPRAKTSTRSQLEKIQRG